MIEPWFDLTYSWVPGPIMGLMGAILGTLAGTLAPRGVGRNLVMRVWLFSIFLSVLMLLLAILAKVLGQPYHVWYGLGLPGLIGTLVFIPNYFVLRNRYIQFEMRKIDAASIKSS